MLALETVKPDLWGINMKGSREFMGRPGNVITWVAGLALT